MTTLTTEEIADQLDELDLELLRIVVHDFSGALEFSEKWIQAGAIDREHLPCKERLSKLAALSIIQRVPKRAGHDGRLPDCYLEDYFCLRDASLAAMILKQVDCDSA